MDAVWLGALAFLIAFGFDLASMAQRAGLKRVILVSACLLFLLALVVALRQPPLFPAPAWVVAAGILLTLLGMGLAAYSLVIELPARSTYVAPGAPSQLITTGTYALTRHPGVLWFAIFLAGLLIANRSLALFIAAPLWLGLDVLYVWLQDRYFFPKQFPDYGRYREHTPMLIPNRHSIRRCLQTLSWPRGRSPERG
jgi:protein-S-isoprenylcysteine O-methyltransferase Ste14